MIGRRGFIRTLVAGTAAMALDPERALWVPGAKRIFDIGGTKPSVCGIGLALRPDWTAMIRMQMDYNRLASDLMERINQGDNRRFLAGSEWPLPVPPIRYDVLYGVPSLRPEFQSKDFLIDQLHFDAPLNAPTLASEPQMDPNVASFPVKVEHRLELSPRACAAVVDTVAPPVVNRLRTIVEEAVEELLRVKK